MLLLNLTAANENAKFKSGSFGNQADWQGQIRPLVTAHSHHKISGNMLRAWVTTLVKLVRSNLAECRRIPDGIEVGIGSCELPH